MVDREKGRELMAAELTYREGAECDLPADLRQVQPAMDRVRKYLEARGFPAAEWAELQLATAEALNNAIEHGCVDQPDATVLLRWSWREEGLALQIRDPGHFEPPSDWAELPEDPLAESGRGGFIVSSYFDEVAHFNSEHGHTLDLFKALATGPQPANTVELEEELAMMTQDLSDSYESLAALFQIGSLLATSKNFADFLEHVLQRLKVLLASDVVYARIRSHDGRWTTHLEGEQTAGSTLPTDLTAHEQGVWDAKQFSSLERIQSLPTGDPLRCWEAALMIGPISFQEVPIGLIAAARRTGAAFTAGQTNLLRTVADFVGVAYTTAELHRQREEQLREHREIEIAAQIQQSLLPTSFPQNAPWEVNGFCHSARTVGGDFFDVVTGPAGQVVILVADSMGKGVPAAMFASLLRATTRACIERTTDPGNLLTEINRLMAPDLTAMGMFITAVVVALQPDGRTLDIANAGHPALLAFQPNQPRALEIESDGDVPLGVLPDTRYRSTRTSLFERDIACMVTDGTFELMDRHGAMLGFPELANRLPGWWTADLSTFTASCLTQLDLIEPGQASDDRTLVAFRAKAS